MILIPYTKSCTTKKKKKKILSLSSMYVFILRMLKNAIFLYKLLALSCSISVLVIWNMISLFFTCLFSHLLKICNQCILYYYYYYYDIINTNFILNYWTDNSINIKDLSFKNWWQNFEESRCINIDHILLKETLVK